MVTPSTTVSPAPPPPPHPLFNSAVGGALCLDFVNTVGGGGPGANRDGPRIHDVVRAERLTTFEALVEWGRWIGVLDAAAARRLLARGRTSPRGAAVALRRAVRLREAIFRLGTSAIDGAAPPDDDLDVLNRELLDARAHQRLVARAPKGTTRRYDLEPIPDDSLESVLWPVALSAVDLFASERVLRLRRCPAARCGWLFEDTSRTGRRQWCDMAVCGNAEKVRRFRERQKGRRGAGVSA